MSTSVKPHMECHWGFYIDIENAQIKFPNNEEILRKKYNVKNFTKNKYYKKIGEKYNIYSDTLMNEFRIDIDFENDIEVEMNSYKHILTKYLNKNMVFKLLSTSVATFSISYFVFYVI